MAQIDETGISSLFSGVGSKIYADAVDTVKAYGMQSYINSGVLVGLSGGADSVMLLCFLLEYSRRTSAFPIVAVHVNHGIRGLEADSDEAFSKELAEGLGVEFISVKYDVPTLARESGTGIEEAARNARYSAFSEIISGRNDINTIAVAHNSDDNAETVILNIMRGSGSRGAAGIRPVRDNIIRPLIRVSKAEIVEVLESGGVPFITDSTNLLSEYKRNYIRHEIMPKLLSISDSPLKMMQRLSENLRSDDDFITGVARDFLKKRNTVLNTELRELHDAVFCRVIDLMSSDASSSISARSLAILKELLSKDNFAYSLIGGATFICEGGACSVKRDEEIREPDYIFNITEGENSLYPFDADFILSDEKIDKTYLNVYKISIQANISSAIISGSLYLRPKKDGDTVFYGGITHKLKKLFNDRKISPSKRGYIPILCDDRGVVWVPGFGVRDDGVPKSARKDKYVALLIVKNGVTENRLYSGSEFSK